MVSYSINAIKRFLREQGYNQVEQAQLINLFEGHGELKYSEGYKDGRDGQRSKLDESRATLRVIRSKYQ